MKCFGFLCVAYLRQAPARSAPTSQNVVSCPSPYKEAKGARSWQSSLFQTFRSWGQREQMYFSALFIRTALHCLDAWNRLLWVSRITFCVTTGSCAFKITSYRNNTSLGTAKTLFFLQDNISQTSILCETAFAVQERTGKNFHNHTKKSTNETAGNKPVKNVWL